MDGRGNFKIVFLRHGESVWNVANIFTGWADVDLSPAGEQEAIEAGKCLKEKGFRFDVVFTSMLRRSIKTAWTVLMNSDNYAMPIINSWRLNERHYGALQGLNKAETAAKHGEAQVKIWRRSYDIPPPEIEVADERHPANDPLYRSVPEDALPGAESLKLTVERVLPYWFDCIAPCVKSGRSVLVAAHGNSLRAICKYLEKMSEEEVLELNIPTAVPLVYELNSKMQFVKKYYLMDPDELAAKMAAVANQGKVAAVPKQVCVCGGGNAAHVIAILTPHLLPETKVHILTTFSDEAERWNKALKENGKMTLNKMEPDKSHNVIESRPTLVTKDPKEAVPGSQVIFLPLPAFAHQGYLETIAEHVAPGTTIVGMPMYPGFMWVLRKIFGGEKAQTMKVVGCDTLPWAARLTVYGTSAEVIGTKSQMLGCSTDPATLLMPQACIGKFPKLLNGSGIVADLMTTNPYIHLSVMYGRWSKWDGNPLDEEPLFYQGADAFTAEIMAALSDEVVLKVKDAIKAMKPELDLERVVSIHQWYIDCYESQTEDTSTLQSCLNTNGGYRGLKHPCIKTEEGKYVPNYGYRYMTEDLPMGLIPLRAIAKMAGVDTPTTDKVLLWCQEKAGKEYLKDGELNGKDIGETRAPVNFGITTIEQMLW